MKYELSDEKAVLSLHEVQAPNSEVTWVYKLTAAERMLPKSAPGPSQLAEGEHPADPDRQYMLKQMKERGFLAVSNDYKQGVKTRLTPAGHDRLLWHRENTWLGRIGRAIWSVADMALSSIVTPIVVSVLTVLVMKWLDLIGSQPPQP